MQKFPVFHDEFWMVCKNKNEYDVAKQLKLMYYELSMQLLNTCQKHEYKEH